MAPCVARDRWHRAWPAIDDDDDVDDDDDDDDYYYYYSVSYTHLRAHET